MADESVESGKAAELKNLPRHYRLVLSDIWGCVHNGVRVFPAAAALLEAWRNQGRTILLVTNAPRPADVVIRQLDGLGLSRATYDAVITSGDTGIAALRKEGIRSVGFIGTRGDREALADSGLELRWDTEGADVVCTGLREGVLDPAAEDETLAAMLSRGARLHCFNPDRVVVRGDRLEPCAGAIAERYEAIGGQVAWYGKPYRPIYDRCLREGSALGGSELRPEEVLAIGDSLTTDYQGAANAGFDFVFVTHGIEAERVERQGASELLRGVATAPYGSRLGQPIAVVRELA